MSESKDRLTLPQSQISRGEEGLKKGASLTINGVKNGLNGVVSASSITNAIANKSSNGARSGVLQQRLHQDQSFSALASEQCALQKQVSLISYNFHHYLIQSSHPSLFSGRVLISCHCQPAVAGWRLMIDPVELETDLSHCLHSKFLAFIHSCNINFALLSLCHSLPVTPQLALIIFHLRDRFVPPYSQSSLLLLFSY